MVHYWDRNHNKSIILHSCSLLYGWIVRWTAWRKQRWCYILY